jgi:hypothetical protein
VTHTWRAQDAGVRRTWAETLQVLRASVAQTHPHQQPERRMKSISILACALLLGACSEAPVMHSSFNDDSRSFYGYNRSFNGDGSPFYGTSYQFGPTSISDPRMRQPSFYMDGEDSIPWLKAVPQTNNR